jgi:segregation and condensation protein B
MASEAQRAVEAILMVADAPVDPGLLAQLLEVTPARVEEICAELARAYDDEDRGFVLVRVAGGYRFQSHPDLAPYLERFVLEGQTARLSAAALETLAIVAYKQPVSRAQIAAIRGVNADGVLRTLEQRGYITEVDRDPGPGQALLYGTTGVLLERLGLDSLADLPPLAEFVPGPEIMEVLEHSLRFESEPRAGPVADDGGDDMADDPALVPTDPGASSMVEESAAWDETREAAESAARVESEGAPGRDEGGIEDFRAEDFQTDDFCAEDLQDDDSPGDDSPGDDSPGDDSPGDPLPGDGPPGDPLPGDGPPGDDSPGDPLPGDGPPGDDSPGHAPPADGPPADDSPGYAPPGDGPPGDPLE